MKNTYKTATKNLVNLIHSYKNWPT